MKGLPVLTGRHLQGLPERIILLTSLPEGSVSEICSKVILRASEGDDNGETLKSGDTEFDVNFSNLGGGLLSVEIPRFSDVGGGVTMTVPPGGEGLGVFPGPVFAF